MEGGEFSNCNKNTLDEGTLMSLIVTKTHWTKACSRWQSMQRTIVARRGGGASKRFESGQKCCVLRAESLHKYPKMLRVRSTFRVPAFPLRARALSTLMSDDFGACAMHSNRAVELCEHIFDNFNLL